MAVLKNVKCQWASVLEPNTKFDPIGKYEIEAILNDAQAAAFADMGISVKSKDEGKVVRFKLKAGGNRKDGTVYRVDPPRVVDANKQEFKELIGNGSTVNIAYEASPWSVHGNSGVSAKLKAIQVVEHVPYSGGTIDEFDELEGTESTAVDDFTEDAPF